MKKSTTSAGKTRTRQHVIADLAVNHLERHILRCGHTAERVRYDYGYDLIVSTYDEKGQVEGGVIHFQVKSTDALPLLKDGKTISWPISRRDLNLWLQEMYPVVLAVYDGMKDRAYWIDVHQHVAPRARNGTLPLRQSLQVRIPITRRVTTRSLESIVKHKRIIHRALEQRRRFYE